MPSVQDITGNSNQFLNNIGLGNKWQLATCSLVAPRSVLGGSDAERTITFYDGKVLKNLGISAIPTSGEAFSYISDILSRSDADRSGKTTVLEDTISFNNNVVTYQLPNGKKVIRTWGTAETTINVAAIFTSSNYLEKLKKLSQLISTSTDLKGFTFHHPTLGSFSNVHISKLELKESPSKAFNTSFVDLDLVTGNVFEVDAAPTQSLFATVTSYINQGIGLAQTISTLANLKEEIAATLSPLTQLANDSDDFENTTGGTVAVEFDEPTFSNSLFTGEGSGGVKSNITKTNPSFGNAVKTLSDNGLSFEFDLEENVKFVNENLTSFTGQQVAGYGTGFIPNTTVTEELVDNLSNIQYSEETTAADGTITVINRKLTGEQGNQFTVQVTTTTYTPVPENYELIESRAAINDIIIYLSVVSSLDETLLNDSVRLIATLENFYNYIRFQVRQVYVVSDRTSIIGVAIQNGVTPDSILRNNPELIAFKPLKPGMELTL